MLVRTLRLAISALGSISGAPSSALLLSLSLVSHCVSRLYLCPNHTRRSATNCPTPRTSMAFLAHGDRPAAGMGMDMDMDMDLALG